MSACIELEVVSSCPAHACRYCERVECDTDCSFADRHTPAEPRKTAKEWRAIGATQADATIANLHALYQRTLHRAELAESKLTSEVIAAQSSWGLEVWCDGKCGCPPLRIKVAPPEDAVALWIQGHGWRTTADAQYCGRCAP